MNVLLTCGRWQLFAAVDLRSSVIREVWVWLC